MTVHLGSEEAREESERWKGWPNWEAEEDWHGRGRESRGLSIIRVHPIELWYCHEVR